MIERFWTDASGAPHREVAVWTDAAPDDPRGRLLSVDLRAQSTPPNPDGRAVLASVSDPAVDAGSLAVDPSALYELPLADGATLIDRDAWQIAADQATADRAEQAEQAEADLAAQATAQATERRSAIEEFAAAAGVDPAVAERLIGAL